MFGGSKSIFDDPLNSDRDDKDDKAAVRQFSWTVGLEDQRSREQSTLNNSRKNDKVQSLQTSGSPTRDMHASTLLPKKSEPIVTPRLLESESALQSTIETSTTAMSSRSDVNNKRQDSDLREIRMLRNLRELPQSEAGAEPGVDPRKLDACVRYGRIRASCKIDVISYSSDCISFETFGNKGFLEYLSNPEAIARAPWPKVRWINVGGISWDVISALTQKYDIHPLALEDVIHGRMNSRSKADYFSKHLFIRVLRHTILPEDAPRPYLEAVTPVISGIPLVQSCQCPPSHHKRQDKAKALAIEDLKRGERVNVATLPFFIFLYKDGTVITLNPHNDSDFVTPIVARLRERGTGLRATADPSMLVQSLLDLIVDKTLEVVDEYQHKILKLEQNVLIRPDMKTVRYLHILSEDLSMHKRTLEPIKKLVYGLGRYDRYRCAALEEGADITKAQGYMSPRSIIYLADVYDHIDHAINSMDMFAFISENLINYTFNMASYEMNDTMKRLTYVTIVCLPLTLLSGYFGMNFGVFWSVSNNSDLYYWEIAVPMMVIVALILMCSDFVERSWIALNARKVGISCRGSF
ncbi:hypothetical protein SCHPADRAFT_934778 [Schizopora paradoxa]|uniref:Cora-domain-containing protein n=1 Tax=Schizopora paradoxa TaxID=27342 RepID=A0A0H2S7B2_9AGAM|nr:hypothetical protein SCHPADRAFT_934778 [Schizopora paradoxa]